MNNYIINIIESGEKVMDRNIKKSMLIFLGTAIVTFGLMSSSFGEGGGTDGAKSKFVERKYASAQHNVHKKPKTPI